MATDIGFNDTTIINSDDKSTLLAMFDKLTRIAEGRRITPLQEINNVTYAHRAMMSSYTLQIGDCCFMIPPEFICVTSESTSQQIITLRQENSMRQKAGSHKRTLLVDLVFNGFNQINGYKVEGAESSSGKDYYLDGLRQMLAQFKCTPFLPIQNEFINGTHGIFAVVLQSITISTVPGFPSLMKAQLTLQEVEMFPYLEMPNAAFKSMIDWDLFRFYYQRFLTESYEYKKLQSLPVDKEYNRFKISILDEAVLAGLDENETTYGNKNDTLLRELCKNENYDLWLDSANSDVKITQFQCGYYNLLTNMQLADNACPTVQFMGGMDTIFNIAIETRDVNVVHAIEHCRMYNDTIVRNNAKYRSLGFVKLESELVAFTGSLFVVIENVITSTTPEFPGLYQIQIQCVSFDIGQSARENLNGFLPFDDNIASQLYGKNYNGSCARLDEGGYVSDHAHDEQVIEQSMNGLFVKIRQDCYAEWKLRSTMEVYPDLFLPTYAETDAFIAKCNAFRASKGLSSLPYNKYPTRPECMLQGIPITNSVQMSGDLILAKDVARHNEYDGYVDPDFYVFYPNSYQSFDLMDYGYDPITRTPITKDITINRKPFGDDEVDESGAYSYYGGTANSSLIERFVSICVDQVGKPYVWGANGPDTFDCSGLVVYGLRQIGVIPSGADYNCSMMTRTTSIFRKISWEEMRRGDLIIRFSDTSKTEAKHVMVSLGNKAANSIVHAKGKDYGVVQEAFSTSTANRCDIYRIIAFDSAPSSNITPGDGDNSTLEGRQEIIWGVMKSLGYNDAAAAGVIGCWTAESSCNPERVEGDYLKSYPGHNTVIFNRSAMNDWTWVLFNAYARQGLSINRSAYKSNGNYYPGIGLAQWTGPRGDAFLKFAGTEWNTLEKQTEFMVQELNSSHSKANTKMLNATNPRQAAADFCRFFEGYTGDSTSRQNTAQKVYDRLAGTMGTLPGSSSGSGGTRSTPTKLKDKRTLTRAEFNSICETIYGQVEGIKSYEEEALGLAQMVFDLITNSQMTKGLGAILNNKEFFPEPSVSPAPAEIESIVESVFCNGAKRWPGSTIKAYLPAVGGKISTFAVYDKMYDKIDDSGMLYFWESSPRKASADVTFTIIESDSTGPESQENYEETYTVNYQVKQASVDKFAEPVFVKTDAILYSDGLFDFWSGKGGNSYKSTMARDVLNDGENIFGSSFVDEAQFSCRGRLVRAFPAYLFCILDEDGQWYAGNKLWTNYYMRRSVVDIQVHETNDMPIATAVLTVANVYNNLSTKQRGLQNYNPKNDLSGFGQLWYEWTGQIIDIGSPNLTESAIKLKQVIYANAKLREGARAHIRMGYGSDPLSLATMINGTISDVSVGDQLTIVVSSDGVELTQHITSATDKSNNGWLGLFGLGEDQESSELIANLLCKRDSLVNYVIAEWFEGSKYGIEHFGLYFNQSALGAVVGVAGGAIAGAGIGAATGAVAGPVGALIGAGIGLLAGLLFSSDVSVKDLWDGYAEQYDLCKNLYKANYKREHYIYASVGNVDGEQNICFNEANMTPWDVMQIATQQVPEYIVKPSYHQFDSRLYFGLPLWMEKYRYDYLGGLVYEECKASTQVHMIESLTNIIDNQVGVTNKYNDTNKKVIYVRGNTPASTRTIHSDDTIYYAKQKTGIIDSAVTQDCLGPDALYEFFGYNIGQESARRIGISNLLYEWQLQYQGEIICTGLPGVKAHDYLLINDSYTTMAGVAIAREVTHSFSTDTGFTTSITPGMIGFSTDQESGLIVAMQNYLQVFNAFSSFLMARTMMKVNYEKNLSTLSQMAMLEQEEKYILINATCQNALGIIRTGAHIYNCYTIIKGISTVGKEIYTFTKACISTKKIAQLGKIAQAAVDGYKTVRGAYKGVKSTLTVVKGAAKAGNIIKAIGGGIAGGVSAVFPPAAIVFLVVSLIIDLLLNELFMWLENRNVCCLLPLWWEGREYVSGINGGQKILLCNNNDSALYGRESGMSENQSEHHNDDMYDSNVD